MDICAVCHYQLNAQSRFCSNCGNVVASQAAPVPQYVPPLYPPACPPQNYPPDLAWRQPHVAEHPPSGYQGQPHLPPNYYQQPPQHQQDWNRHPAASHGIAQTFGLHPAGVVLTLAVNTMVFVTGLGTFGVGWLTSIPVGLVLGGIIYQIQRKWYGDDHESALLKAFIVAFLTAIPSSLPGYLTIPSGILGFFRRKN